SQDVGRTAISGLNVVLVSTNGSVGANTTNGAITVNATNLTANGTADVFVSATGAVNLQDSSIAALGGSLTNGAGSSNTFGLNAGTDITQTSGSTAVTAGTVVFVAGGKIGSTGAISVNAGHLTAQGGAGGS